MGKTGIKVTIFLFAALIFVGSWFAVLYSEESRRLAKAEEAQAQYFAHLEEIDRDRKAYFDSIAENRQQQIAAMEAARVQYEELLKSQDAQVKAQGKAVTQVVEKPVTKTETVKVAKPKSTRSTKTS